MQEHTRIDHRSTPDADPLHDDHMAQQSLTEVAAAKPHARFPQQVPGPTAPSLQVLPGQPTPLLQDDHRPPGLSVPQSGHATAESGPDNRDISIPPGHSTSLPPPPRRCDPAAARRGTST
mgnify:CR=1 FL=1